MLKRAREVIASGDERLVVDYAIEANRTVSRTSEELEEAKAFLRKVALGRVGKLPSVELEGDLGVATISFSRSEAKPKKGADLRDIEVNLPPEVFARLFSKEVVVHPVRDFGDHLDRLTPSERAILDRFIEIRPSTPKVHLTK